VKKSSSKYRLPIAEEEIVQKKWIARLTSSVTWSVYAVLALAILVIKPAWWVSVLLVVVTTAGLWYYWRLTGAALEKRILKRVITKSNLKQEGEMSNRIRALQEQRAGDLAITLGKFVEMKKEIEAEIARGENVPEAAAQVEGMIDELCFGVADQLEHLAQAQGRLARPDVQLVADKEEELKDTQRELVTTISQAYKTLTNTRYNIDAILHPLKLDVPKRDGELDEVVSRLKEETEIAKRVRSRMVDADRLS
jgi:hypothetical protein